VAVLAGLSFVLGWQRGEQWGVVVDLTACLAAGATVRWPRIGGVFLGVVLAAYLFTPVGWASMGEYAALIPILGTGMRGQRRVRLWMTVGYGALLIARTYEDYPGQPLFLMGTLVWAALIGVLWLIGNLFAAYQRAQAEARAAALVQQRLAVARNLHDTAARTLATTLLHAERARLSGDAADWHGVLDGIRSASRELRQVLEVLRDASLAQQPDATPSLLSQAATDAAATLSAHGFPTAVTVEGDLSALPAEVTGVIVAALGEATANIERHGVPGRPCAVIVAVDDERVDMVVSNEVERPTDAAAEGPSMGLLGIAERLAPLGGALDARQEGAKWLMQVTVPTTT
jgi:signal transduction histidine kinase